MKDKPVMSYSLHQNDVKMLNYLKDLPNGKFIECGACNGVTQSNTKMYEDHLGWTGLLIEPNKQKCEEARTHRPNSIIENYALVSSEYTKGTVRGYFQENTHHPESYAIEDNFYFTESSGVGWQEFTSDLIDVPCITLKELVQKHNLEGETVHFFSLDVEGCELQVLDGLDLSINRPLYIHVETCNFKNRQEDMRRYMHKYNYSFVERISDNDDLYIRNRYVNEN
tara:strand:+ start:517 stop:1191 length:675 start_codon:yes stop_codon:yes gene_type:complete